MKKIINGKKYDTQTARTIGFWCNNRYGDLDYCEETLYQKRTKEFFLYGTGGARSKYAYYYGDRFTSGEEIIPLSEGDARRWAEKHLGVSEYENVFGVTAE